MLSTYLQSLCTFAWLIKIIWETATLITCCVLIFSWNLLFIKETAKQELYNAVEFHVETVSFPSSCYFGYMNIITGPFQGFLQHVPLYPCVFSAFVHHNTDPHSAFKNSLKFSCFFLIYLTHCLSDMYQL
jgi:hypothetical protein